MPSGTAARSTESGPPLAALGGPASKATLPIDNVPRLALMIVILINARGYVGNQPPEEALSKVPLGFKQWMRRARTMSTDASSPVPGSFRAPMRRPTGNQRCRRKPPSQKWRRRTSSRAATASQGCGTIRDDAASGTHVLAPTKTDADTRTPAPKPVRRRVQGARRR
jgi:hypothetical protein